MEFDLLCIGDLNLDLLVRVPRFPVEDDEVEAQEMRSFPGGDAANTAAQAARLGMKTALIGCVGDDEAGRTLLAALKHKRVDTSLVQISREQPTGSTILTVRSDGQRNLIASRGANSLLKLGEAHRAVLNSAKRVHVSDPLPQTVQALGRLIDPKMTRVSLDPGSITAARGLPELLTLLQLTRTYMSNQRELLLLTGDADLETAAKRLMKLGVEQIFVKCGAQGSRVFTRDGEWSVPGFQKDVTDATGAGDAFDAGILYAQMHQLSPGDAARFANAVGVLAAAGLGGQESQPDLSQVEHLLQGA
jgi:ribokinase